MTETGLFTPRHYYGLMLENNYIPHEKIDFSLGPLEPEQLQLLWLCHQEADKFGAALKRGETGIVCTGIGLSGPPHAGTISQIVRAIRLQGAGIPVQFVLGDLDALNGKQIPLERTMELAKQYREFVLALGFQDDGTSILRTQADHPEVLLTAYFIANFMNEEMFSHAREDLHEYYASHGKVDRSNKMTYRRRVSLNLMTADFIHNMTEGGIFNVLVSLGVDEHVYVRFARETIDNMIKAGFLQNGRLLAGIYTAIIRGLYRHPKSSKSFPESAIHAELSNEEILSRLLNGDEYDRPINSPVLQMMMTLSDLKPEQINTIYQACKENGDQWIQLKREFAEYLIREILSKWPK